MAAAGGAEGAQAHAAACRALWLRAAILQRHLEPCRPESGHFWRSVEALMVRNARMLFMHHHVECHSTPSSPARRPPVAPASSHLTSATTPSSLSLASCMPVHRPQHSVPYSLCGEGPAVSCSCLA